MDSIGNELEHLAVEAAWLHERLAPGVFIPIADESSLGLIEKRWNRWASSLAPREPALLEARLSLSGWDSSFVKPRLGKVRLRDPNSPPAWTRIFRRVLEAASEIDWEAPDATLSGQAKAEIFYLPFLKAARTLLAESAGDLLGLLVPRAMDECEGSLLRRLSTIAGGLLEQERSFEPQRFARDCYEKPDFFRTYPVAARLLSEAIQFWAEAVTECLQRLDHDLPEIQRKSFLGREPGRVASLSAFASDTHCRGRGVLFITFENGERIVYKPRSLGLEAAYFDLVRWLEARGAPVSLMATRALDCGDHGWMEWIEAFECKSEEGVASFYRRIGGLLALCHALAGNDLHYENLIARADHPVPVDTEVWMAPVIDKPELFSGYPALERAWEILRESVLSAAVLPMWIPIGRSHAWNIGALERDESSIRVMTDRTGDNLPKLHGKFRSPRAYQNDIVWGFRETIEFLRDNHEHLLAKDGPMQSFRNLPVRFINRPSELYGRALRASVAPEALRSGLTRSLQLEAFLKPVLYASGSARFVQLAIGTSEIRALERGDVPFFQGRVGNLSIHLPEVGADIPEFFSRDGFGLAQTRLRNFSDEDLARQTQFITLSYDLIEERPPVPDQAWEPKAVDFKAQADVIAGRIVESAIQAEGAPAWIAPQELPEVGRFALKPLDTSLYDGTLGTMLFLLAMERIGEDATMGTLARHIFRSCARLTRYPLHRRLWLAQRPGLMGAGGQIYALCAGYSLCGDEGMLELARALASCLTEDFIRQPGPSGLLLGTAGMLQALLALHTHTRESRWLDLSAMAKDHVLTNKPEAANRVEAIALASLMGDDDNEPLAAAAKEAAMPDLSAEDGFCSGNAGRADVLITASQRFSDPKYLEAAANLMRRATARAETNGGYVCYGNHPPSVSGPGFFQGLSGIGYTFLRLSDPSLPSILSPFQNFISGLSTPSGH